MRALALVAAGSYAASREQTDWHERDSYSGWVTDAATGQPIEGAVVVAVWQILWRHHMFIVEGTPDFEVIRLEETLTDKNEQGPQRRTSGSGLAFCLANSGGDIKTWISVGCQQALIPLGTSRVRRK